ncbi:MAG TPA: LLM class F420-dependent oxidoreductase [Amycolatopsis sp.]|nr:LLM class F420-dependent oxidoreductase [Amycolatopsis sp.]
MRFYVGVGHRGSPREFLAIARHAEQLGLHGITFGDHVGMAPAPVSPYPSGNGRRSFAIDTPWPDVWVLSSALAAVTTRLHFLSTVYLLPLRHPLLTAKAVATAALIAGDRIELGVGVGWQREEFEALGVDFTSRGRRTDETIELLRALWRPGPTEHHGEFFEFGQLVTEPALERPVPIYVGGSSDAAMRRAARLGDGFITMPATLTALAELIPRLRDLVAERGRDAEAFQILANNVDARTAEDYARLAELGATVALVRPTNFGCNDGSSDIRSALEDFAERVVVPLSATS